SGATREGAMMHLAFALSSRGIPQIYYGDELGMAGGHDPDNRKDFPGGFSGDARDAFTKTGRTADEQKMFEWTREWIKIRRSRLAVREGRTQDLYYDDEAYVFARVTAEGTLPRLNVFAFNPSNVEKSVSYVNPLVKGVPKITITLKPRSASAFGDMLH
ncbi:MAG TPA: alpha-amylase family glycosyl hydrolase, partial [Pyrinomonadaceae bacterium]|nr:alpha-amylase family glycosyl hydrolase [Pyrinomonadaceae bacterium]